MSVRDAWIDVNGVRLHHLDRDGSGLPVVCLHGLTGNAHNFDGLRGSIDPAHRVLALDVRGRGESAWAPAETYSLLQYADDLARWIDAVGLERVGLVGTSMGGMIAMRFASSHPQRVARMVLNDVGPVLERSGLERIRAYVGDAPEVFADLDAVVRWFRRSYPGQRLPEERVREWAGFATRPLEQGGLGWRYDPAIRKALQTRLPADPGTDLWETFESLRCPVLVVRGGASDLLSGETVAQMVRRGADCSSVEVPGVGHAPGLTEPEAVERIRPFLSPLLEG